MSPRRTTPWPAGTPCWVDVTSPDLEGSQAFYAGLFGWTFGPGDPNFGGYCLAQVDDAPTAGLAPAMEGVAPTWTLYFGSDDVDAAAAAITEHGGRVEAGPMDIGPAGRMLVGSDPAGASFGIWQAGAHIGTYAYSEPGALAWEDLRSTDPDAARAFYAGVLGWTYQPLPMAGPDYTTVHRTGEQAPMGGLGGMMGLDSFPSHWIVYFGVADVDVALAFTEANGGHLVSPGFDTEFGRMAAITDPYGASLWIVESPPETVDAS